MDTKARIGAAGSGQALAVAGARSGAHAGLESGRPLSRPRSRRRFRPTSRRPAAEAKAIQERYQGKLATLAKDGAQLAEAIAAYEALSDTLGKLGSYAGLLYAADTANPEHAKFYGDIQEKLTAITTDLIFFELETQQDRRRRAGARAEGAGARPLQALARRPAQGEALPARGEARAAVPREIDHLAQLLEPPVQRDHDGAALRGGGREGAAGARADAQLPDASRRRASGRPPRKRWRKCSRTTSACSRSSPTRWPRTRRSPTAGAASRTWPTAATSPTASSARWWRRWSRRARRLSRAPRTATTP